MENVELLNYLRTARTAGLTSQEIGQALAQAGWQISDIIDTVWSGLVKPPTPPAPPIEPAIFVQNIKKHYGSVKALDNISLSVQPGTVLALLGPNGAGKTTLVRVLSTLLKPDSGWAMLYGRDIVSEAPLLRSYIGLTGQFAAIDENLTGRENIEIA